MNQRINPERLKMYNRIWDGISKADDKTLFGIECFQAGLMARNNGNEESGKGE